MNPGLVLPDDVRRRVFLIGLPGAGKSTLGRALAAELHWPFLDLDEVLAADAGEPVPALLRRVGEPAFRELEAAALRRVGTRAPLVLATGGGTPCFHESIAWLLAHGRVLWLDVAPTEIVTRLTHAAAGPLTDRPLLAAAAHSDPQTTREALQTQLEQTLARRRPFYAQAPVRLVEPAVSAARQALGL